jgi:hypothetical protein
MLVGSIYGWDAGLDDLFNPLSIRNRDDCLEPMRALQKYALTKGIELHTVDVVKSLGLTPSFNLYVESLPLDRDAPGKNCLLLFETPLTVPINGDYAYLNQFDEIFTWNFELQGKKNSGALKSVLDRPQLTEMRIPNSIPKKFFNEYPVFGFADRPQFCCLIGSNRHANQYDNRELYSERVRAIRWFEQRVPNYFYLYGNGWNVPEKRLGHLGKLRYRLEKVIPFLTGKPIFPSYRGPLTEKWLGLSKSRFCICFENARDIPGYLTEKIFDCLFSGCIPVYWGEPNIQEWIPSQCFIDFRKFNSYDDLYQYIVGMSEEVFISMQKAGREFILSDSFKPHNSESFSRTVIDRIYDQII